MINETVIDNPLVQMEGVSRVFSRAHAGDLVVIEDVNMTIYPGQFHAVMGKSGSGKSTFMQLVALFDHPTSGVIRWQSEDATKLSQRQIDQARQGLFGFVHQGHHLLPGMSALDNVAWPLRIARVPIKAALCRAENLLCRVGLGDRIHHTPGKLSGGERQRVGIARALANRPRLIIADEPTGNLDIETGSKIFNLLSTLCEAEDMSMLLVTHDSSLASKAQFQWRFENRHLVKVSEIIDLPPPPLVQLPNYGLPYMSMPGGGL